MSDHTKQYLEFCRLSEEIDAHEKLLEAIAETQRRLTAEAAKRVGVSASHEWRRYSIPRSHFELSYMGCNRVLVSARYPDDGTEIHSFEIHESVVRGDYDDFTSSIEAEMGVTKTLGKKARAAEIAELRARLAILESQR